MAVNSGKTLDERIEWAMAEVKRLRAMMIRPAEPAEPKVKTTRKAQR